MRDIDRLHYMDSLRAMAMFMGLVLHAGILFSQWTIDPCRVHDEPSMFLHYIMELIHVFRMELFFLVAGFFSILVYQKRGIKSYAKNRTLRILIPFLFCVFILQPAIAGGFYLDITDSNETFLSQYVKYFTHPSYILNEPFPLGNFFWHFWFLQVLIYFIAVFLIGQLVVEKLNIQFRFLPTFVNALGSKIGIIILAIITYPILIFSPPWADVPTIGTSIDVLFYYGLFFAIGVLFFKHSKIFDLFQSNIKYHIVPFVIALIILIPLVDELRLKSQPEILLQNCSFFTEDDMQIAIMGNFPLFQNPFNFSAINAPFDWHLMCLLRAYTTWCAIVFFIAIFKKFMNKQTALGRYIADSSYFIYLIHLPIQFSISYYLRDHFGSSIFCFTVCLTSSLLICFLLYHFTCRATLIGTLLSGKKYSFSMTEEFKELRVLFGAKYFYLTLVFITGVLFVADRIESKEEKKLLYFSLHAEPENIKKYLNENKNKDFSEITRWDGRNALHMASSKMSKPRPDDVIAESVKLLLSKGFDPNSVDNFGQTPLHYAVKDGNKSAIQLLLQAGANPNSTESYNGNSALHYAATLGVEEFIRALLAAGGDVNLTRKDGENSLDIFKKFHSKSFPTK